MPGGSPEFESPTSAPASGADGRRDPSSSNGVWIESSNRDGGTVFLQQASITYEFTDSRGNPAPVTVIACPEDAPGDENLKTRWQQWTTWTSCNILNGWTVTQPAPHQITLTWSAPSLIEVSTSTRGTGWASGYFVNYFFTECTNTPYMKSYKSADYYDANGYQHYGVETTRDRPG